MLFFRNCPCTASVRRIPSIRSSLLQRGCSWATGSARKPLAWAPLHELQPLPGACSSRSPCVVASFMACPLAVAQGPTQAAAWLCGLVSSSMGYREILVPPCSSPWAAEETLSQHLEHLILSSSSHPGAHGALSHAYFPLFSLAVCCTVFVTLFKTFLQRHHHYGCGAQLCFLLGLLEPAGSAVSGIGHF